MKKTILLLAIAMASFMAQAQSIAVLEAYQLGNYNIVYLEDLMETRKGDIIAPVRLFDINGQDVSDFGYCFLKLSRQDATVIDSTVVEAEFTNIGLLEPNPLDEGYLFINEEYDYDCECSRLKIRNFDENFSLLEQTVLPFDDTIYGGLPMYLSEGEDFIMGYSKSGNLVLIRFGIDGEQKDKTVFHDTLIGTVNYAEWGLRLWNDSPREYAVWGSARDPENGNVPTGYVFVFDSLLQVRETIRYNYEFQSQTWFENDDLSLTTLDDGSYLLSCPYHIWNGNYMTQGVQVTKRNKTIHEVLETAFFQYDTQDGTPYVADMVKDESGDVFLAYGDTQGISRFAVAKMDSNLNIIWKRYCLMTRMWDNSIRMKLLSNGGAGVAIPLFNFISNPGYVSIIIVNDDYDSIEEQDGISIRPYTYYPNPVRDELRLQFSPDVTPTRIELFDLQGHMVLKQDSALENLNVAGLSVGTYTMRVTLDSGKVFSDEVVKE